MATVRRTYFKKLASRGPINLQNTNFASTAGALITFKPYSGLRFRSYMSFNKQINMFLYFNISRIKVNDTPIKE